MRGHVFIGQILATSIVACFACIVQTVSAQTYELRKVEVNGHTMYVSLEHLYKHNKLEDTIMCFYYNTDTTQLSHSVHQYTNTEIYAEEFRFREALVSSLFDDLMKEENDSIYYRRFIILPITKMFDTEERECITSNKLCRNMYIDLYLNFDGKIANVGLHIPSKSYGLCLKNDKIYAILKYAMEVNIALPQYTNFLKTHHEAVKKFRKLRNFAFPLGIFPKDLKPIYDSEQDATNTSK